jgi:thioredoxin 1
LEFLSLFEEAIVARVFDTPIKTNDQSVDRVLAAGLPVVLVFLDGTASSDLERAMDRLAEKNAGHLLVAQIQVRDNPETKRRYGITSSPAVVTIQDTQERSKAQGISAADLEAHVDYLLERGPMPQPRKAAGGNGRVSTSGVSRGTQARPSAGTSTSRPVVVTDASFDRDVMSSPLPVLVDFWAPWCGPCRMTDPIVEKFAGEYAGRLRVAKVNVDENPYIAQRFGIQSIPTMMVVRNGQIVDRWMGAMPEPVLRNKVSPHI